MTVLVLTGQFRSGVHLPAGPRVAYCGADPGLVMSYLYFIVSSNDDVTQTWYSCCSSSSVSSVSSTEAAVSMLMGDCRVPDSEIE